MRLNKLSVSCIALVLIFLLSVVLYTPRHIVISHGQESCMWATDSFLLKWKHSVEKQYWQERYQQYGDDLRLTHSFVQSFGAGVPSMGEPISAPQGYVGFQSNVQLTEINWVVSPNMQGEILSEQADGQVFSVYKKVKEYSAIQIKVVRQSYWKWLLVEQCNDKSTSFK